MQEEDDVSESADNEIKRKFREALDRKNHRQSSATAHLDGQSKVHDAHGSADHNASSAGRAGRPGRPRPVRSPK